MKEKEVVQEKEDEEEGINKFGYKHTHTQIQYSLGVWSLVQLNVCDISSVCGASNVWNVWNASSVQSPVLWLQITFLSQEGLLSAQYSPSTVSTILSLSVSKSRTR